MHETPIFFDSWSKIGRTALLSLLAYGALVFLLRVSGKRTLTKLNVFDFVFTVALGSALSMIILSPDVTLADGILAILTLILLQMGLSWACLGSPRINRIVNGEPTLLLYRGEFLRDSMRKQRVTAEEIRAAVRNMGLASLEVVNSVVLETDGTFSIVCRSGDGSLSAVEDVPGHAAFRPKKRT